MKWYWQILLSNSIVINQKLLNKSFPYCHNGMSLKFKLALKYDFSLSKSFNRTIVNLKILLWYYYYLKDSRLFSFSFPYEWLIKRKNSCEIVFL